MADGLEAARGAMSQKKMARVSDHLDRAGEMAREGLREARRSVQALRPLALEEKPLALALQDMMERMTMGVPMVAQLTLQGDPQDLLPEWETNLLRIGQEAMTNALRHARAGLFDVHLVFNHREVRLELRDNGRGFDSSKRHEGFGLQGIKERTESMGGQCTIQSSPGYGAVVSVVVPLTIVAES